MSTVYLYLYWIHKDRVHYSTVGTSTVYTLLGISTVYNVRVTTVRSTSTVYTILGTQVPCIMYAVPVRSTCIAYMSCTIVHDMCSVFSQNTCHDTTISIHSFIIPLSTPLLSSQKYTSIVSTMIEM
jgi:hypothetical protein